MFRFSTKALLTLATIAAVLSAGVGWFIRWDPLGGLFASLPAGPTTDRESWCYTLTEVLPESNAETGKPFEKLSVYRLYDSGWDSEYFVRIEETPATFASLISDNHVVAIPATDPAAIAFWSRAPSDFLIPQQVGEHEFYATPKWHHPGVTIYDLSVGFVVLRDKEAGLLYVWHMWCF